MGASKKSQRMALVALVLAVSACGQNAEPEPTKAEQSGYNADITKATTSNDLSKADLAWQAQNTYGWDCSEVVSRDEMTPEGYFFISCASGKKLRVYPRQGQHPKITNESGSYN